MKKDAKYEQLSFGSIINTVDSDRCPEHFPLHWHKYVEIIAIPEVSDTMDDAETLGVLRVNQEIYELYSGDILLIWPGELHETIENKQHHMITIQSPLTALTDMKDFSSYMNRFHNLHQLRYDKTPERNQTMFFSIDQIMHIAKETENPFRNIEMLIHLYEMFIALGYEVCQNTETEDKIEQNDQSVTKKIWLACQYIQDNCTNNITLEDVATYVGFSSCYFSRSFRKVTSYSFVEYLMIQRVKQMQILLMDEQLSITEAAYQAGFKSISTLNRVFRQCSGCSPREYRRYYQSGMNGDQYA